ncbi:hypothetical protein HDF09_003341 [Edaphobacter lichenicola]|uniref:Uncharacterized protein n=1 Tax=Tunturiibacter empetritectus TaxID=3069691 RepID=A0A7W8MSR3_9BACT|nr:hypothetical protein [Edaphobacter lichenicola]
MLITIIADDPYGTAATSEAVCKVKRAAAHAVAR